ncbi:hypothetical protein FISHEDRAFT_77032 [Fistulina hepatica ATCC 64428]|uniref:Association with the SNF1 complex (ASC) domain-containing protein n=1 Tax=Fistulina hepatica ATCC 64428 TaxID=1128425 RepID=A0A0D7A3P9_9AGAR|nr:hypothetical protein FISHEDRAFT_77032 [Fistulina hepatica ATCC 64428]
MGNANSSAGNPKKLNRVHVDVHDSPPSHLPHRSLRIKRKSLELPGLTSLAPSPQVTSRDFAAKSSSIPIPSSGAPQSQNRPLNVLSSESLSASDVPRGRQITSQERPSPDSNRAAAPDKPAFVQQTVHSTIPLGLPEPLAPDTSKTSISTSETDFHNVLIVWHGGGHVVCLARAGDDNWQGRTVMEQDSMNPKMFSTKIQLPTGTHHFRFLVDQQWRVSLELPTAVDDEGSLANYVDVAPPSPLSLSLSPGLSPPPRRSHGLSFWSSTSSSDSLNGNKGSRDDVYQAVSPSTKKAAVWTSEIPLELIAAAEEEEEYLAAQNNSSGGTLPPHPHVPSVPSRPRHLDKLILNARPPISGPSGTPSPPLREGRSRKMHGLSRMASPAEEVEPRMPPIPVTTASGTDVTRRGTVRVSGGDTSSFVAGDVDSAAPDDTSVLPVPSHVVIQHLSTSAIKHGVLAVGTTTRYRKKYLTTIYYKPT